MEIFDEYEVDFGANGTLIAYELKLCVRRSNDSMSNFKVGDRVMILPGIATPFVGMVGTISEIRPHDRGIETMERHIVVFQRREKLSFYGVELMRIQKLN